MSMIRCEHPCKYQKEGYCGLDRAVSAVSSLSYVNDCIYYVPAGRKPPRKAAPRPGKRPGEWR